MKDLMRLYLRGMQDMTVERYRSGRSPHLLQRAASGSLTRQQLVSIIDIRYQAANFFEDMLRRLISTIDQAANLEDEARMQLRHSVQENLDDEMGKAGYGGRHADGRRDLLQALGIPYDKWASRLGSYDCFGKVHPVALELVTSMRQAISTPYPLRGVAALLEYEHRISLDGIGDYWLLLQGLEKLFPELRPERNYQEGDPFWHVSSHAEHDDAHAKLAEDGLIAAFSTIDDASQIFAGMMLASRAIDRFWTDLESVVAPT